MGGDDDDNKWGIGIIICLLLVAGFAPVVYVIGVIIDIKNSADLTSLRIK